MPATTTCASLPYPIDSDPIDVANDMRRLAQAADAALCAMTGGSIGAVIPLGTILPYFDTGATLPPTFLRLNGAPFNAATYPELSAHLGGGSVLPDLRERFLRGTGGAFPTNGQVGGFADSIVVSHDHDGPSHSHTMTHGHTASSGEADRNHTHGFSGGTAGAGSHVHGGSENGFVIWSNNYGTNQSSTTPPGPNQPWALTWITATGEAGWHGHGFSGDTGGFSSQHAHAVGVNNHSGSTGVSGTQKTAAAGLAATNRNLPPFFNVTYIIKATP